MWTLVPSGPKLPAGLSPAEAWLRVWKEAASSPHADRGLGSRGGRTAVFSSSEENVEFHARCFMCHIYNINISK